ncbi:MetQ/NlpA family ABC transporter substrate-binding protein [Clostridium ganghwense]|uniref:Lipoprotein n=1 Tax=Clostridium ganghwense TaxID=312089 RepID=A0ABT4CJ53_9CLOT|nr:MetQ/NlpA family ABC transporter substrate-binding protein [Clostridium ganghwense]MCY6369083.1 MetQ/NlpA family ABC transporter substrate-binding protein [Clostridium ganghwense]
MKKIVLSLLSFILIFGFIGCSDKSTSKKEGEDKKVIKIGITPNPFREIVEEVKPLLKEKGYELDIVEFTDYITPNTALADGELDVNLYQHIPFLNKFNNDKHTDLTYTAKVLVAPIGAYSNKIKDLKELKENAEVVIPNDPTNEARALKLLASVGLIKIKDSDFVTILDIIENPKKLSIKELDAAQIARTLDQVDVGIINTNFALAAKLDPVKDAIYRESKDSPYSNVLAVRKEEKDKPYVKALSEVLNSKELKKFIEDKYKGVLIPSF